MDDSSVWHRLREKGLRMTSVKKEIVHLFISGACGLSAMDVLESLESAPHISTVHRCLNSLEDAGFLRLDRNDQGILRYRCSRSFYPDHGHFRCKECGRRFPVKFSLPKEFLDRVEQEGEFRISSCDFELEGRCGRCSAEC